MARKFVAEGAQVLIADRDEAAANRVAEALGAKAIRVDVAVAADLHAAVEAACTSAATLVGSTSWSTTPESVIRRSY